MAFFEGALATGGFIRGNREELRLADMPHLSLRIAAVVPDPQDSFNGGPNDDTYTGGAGNDTINGNDGNDTLAGAGGADTIDGGAGSDHIFSAGITEWKHGYYGVDPVFPVLDTGTEVDTLLGGPGLDQIYAGYGDNVDGGADGAFLLISLQGATSGVTVDFNALNNNGSLVIVGGTITNISAVQLVDGSNFADTITGSGFGYASPDIRGLGGDDHLIAGYYQSNLYGGDGNDVLDSGGPYGGVLYGEAGNDTINMSGDKSAYGGDGDDIFNGSGYFHGGAGNDTFNLQYVGYPLTEYGDGGADLFNGSTDGDVVYGGADGDTIHGNGGNDRLYSAGTTDEYGALTDTIDHGIEHDVLSGDGGDDYLSIGYGDTADGGTGTNTLFLSLDGATTGVTFDGDALAAGSITIGNGTIANIQKVERIIGSNYADTVTLHTQDSPVTVNAGGGDDHLTGSGSAVTFYGEDGNDTLVGSNAGDTLYGGKSADSISGADGDDTIYIKTGDTAAGETIDGGAGADTINATDYDPSGGLNDISGETITNVESLIATSIKMTPAQLQSFQFMRVAGGGITLTTGGNASLAGVHVTVFGTIVLADTATNFDMTGAILISPTQGFSVTGGTAGDTITTLDNADTINGGGGDDIINSGGGDDILIGGNGRDTFHAGAGNDSITIGSNQYAAGEIYDGGDGTDTLIAVDSIDISSSTLISIERIGIAYGSSVSMTAAQLQGIGAFYTPGYSGALTETINLTTGGTTSFSGAGDLLVFNLATADTSLDLSGVTNATSVAVNGKGGNDTIIGSRFDDTLHGGGGDDWLDGGAGNDAMAGGDGYDVYVVDSAGDTVTEAAGGGHDTVRTTLASYTLGNEVEDLTYTGSGAFNGTGNSLSNYISGGAGDDTLTGGANNDWLYGGAGNDTMIGGEDNDQYYVDDAGDVVVELAGQGSDTVNTTLASYTLGSELEDLKNVALGTGAFYGVGNAANNMMTGGLGSDTLLGMDGNDTLDGGSGADHLVGGAGDDDYYLDDPGDLTFEDANGGYDEVFSSLSQYLYANVERLTLTGVDDVYGVGNDLSNDIHGNAGSNLLIGGGGGDSIYGGGGADSIYGQDSFDFLRGGDGVDFIAGGADNDRLYGDDDSDALYGEDGDDIIDGGDDFSTDIMVGGAGNDVIHGDSGQGDYDLMDGGAGNDTYYVDTYADVTYEAADGGTDTVYASTIAGSGYYLYANVENLVLTGNTFYGVGNELANVMTGSAQANWLLGGAGNDTLDGKAGDDVLFGQDGADIFVFGHGTGGDTIADFTAGTDRIDLSAIGFASYQDVVNSMHEVNGTTAIDLGGGDFIVLQGVAAASLHQGDFILAGGSSGSIQAEQLAREAADPLSDAASRAGLIHQFDSPHAIISTANLGIVGL